MIPQHSSCWAKYDATSQSSNVSLFHDYAVLDRKNKSFVLGTPVWLVHAGNHGALECKRPVSYNDPKWQSISCFLQLYTEHRTDAGDLQRGVFETSTASVRQFPFPDIITHVNMSMMEEGTLTIPEEELAEIEQTTAVLLQPRPSHPRRPGSQYRNDEGITRTVVCPEPQSMDGTGPRRSNRTRTVFSFNSWS